MSTNSIGDFVITEANSTKATSLDGKATELLSDSDLGPVTYYNDTLCHISPVPRPIFDPWLARWTIKDPIEDYNGSCMTFHHYDGERSHHRDGVIKDLESKCWECIEHVAHPNESSVSMSLPDCLSKRGADLSQEDEQSIRDDLTFLRSGWKTKLKPDLSSFEQYKSAQKEIQTRFIKYLTKCSTRIADHHIEKKDIQTRVKSLDDIDEKLKRYLSINHNIIEINDETLKVACSSVSRPSIWLIMGNSPLGYSRAITEYTKEVKLIPEFDTKWDVIILPSTDDESNKRAYDKQRLYREKASWDIEFEMFEMNSTTADDDDEEMRDSLRPDGDFFDCDSNTQLKTKRMEIYVEEQYDKIRKREDGLKAILQDVKERCKRYEDEDLFDVHTMSGKEYSMYDPLSARSLDYLNYDELPRVLRAEFEQVSDELEHRRKNPKYQQSLSQVQQHEIKQFLDDETARLDPWAWKGGSPASVYEA